MMTARRADGAERMTLTALRAGGEFGNGAESECCRVNRTMAYMDSSNTERNYHLRYLCTIHSVALIRSDSAALQQPLRPGYYVYFKIVFTTRIHFSYNFKFHTLD